MEQIENHNEFMRIAKSISLRARAVSERILQLRYQGARDCSGSVVDRHLEKRAKEANARADFFSIMADWLSGQ